MQNKAETKLDTRLVPFNPALATVANVATRALAVKVTDDASQKVAQTVYKESRDVRKQVDALRTSVTKPLKDFCKEVEAYAATIIAPLDAAEKHVNAQLVARANVLEAERREALRLVEVERKRKEEELQALAARDVTPPADDDYSSLMKSDEEVATETAQAKIVQQVEVETAKATADKEHSQALKAAEAIKVKGQQMVWVFKVISPELVPREYLTVDETKIRLAVRDGARQIPGVVIKEEIKITAR